MIINYWKQCQYHENGIKTNKIDVKTHQNGINTTKTDVITTKKKLCQIPQKRLKTTENDATTSKTNVLSAFC